MRRVFPRGESVACSVLSSSISNDDSETKPKHRKEKFGLRFYALWMHNGELEQNILK